MPCLTLELILEKDHRFGFPRSKVRAADGSGHCAARGITPALMALTPPIVVDRICSIFNCPGPLRLH
jgi:hypothetical protein